LPSKLPREAKLFGAVSLFNDFASEMVYPLLPALLTRLGAGAVALGALDGAADFASAIVKVGAGRLADRPGRRGPLVVAGYAVAVLVRPLIALASATSQVIALRVTDRLGKGVRTPPRDAIIADVTPVELRSRAFGLQRSLDHLGAVLGPVAAWALLASGTLDVRGVIAASLAPGVLVLVLALLAVRGGVPIAGSAPHPPPPRADVWMLPAPVAAVAAFSFVRLPEALLLLRAQQLGVSVAVVGLLWAAVHVAKALGSFAGGHTGDRLGVRVLRVAWMAYAVLIVAFGAAGAAWQAWGLFLGLGFVAGFTEGPERALVAYFGAGRQGSAFGSYHGTQGIAALAGGLALGLLYQVTGAGLACAASAVGAVALVLVWRPSPTARP
jgi:MFS family permease